MTPASTLRDQLLDQVHRVGVTACTRIVLRIRQDDRPPAWCRMSRRLEDGLVDGVQLERELVLACSHFTCKAGHGLSRRGVAVAAGVDGWTAVGDVRRREAGHEADQQQRRLLQPLCLLHQRAHRLRQRRLRRERYQEVELLERDHRLWLPEHVLQDARRLRAAFRHVDVRIRAVRHDCGCSPRHQRRNVGVVIETGDDGDVGTDQRAHASQQFAVGVVDVTGYHCAVQVEVDAVDAAGTAQILE
jgi:hypothetical protein